MRGGEDENKKEKIIWRGRKRKQKEERKIKKYQKKKKWKTLKMIMKKERIAER